MGPIFFPRETLTGFLATKGDDVLMNDIMAFSKMNNGPGPHPVQVEMHSQAVSLTTPQSLTFNSDLVIFFSYYDFHKKILSQAGCEAAFLQPQYSN